MKTILTTLLFLYTNPLWAMQVAAEPRLHDGPEHVSSDDDEGSELPLDPRFLFVKGRLKPFDLHNYRTAKMICEGLKDEKKKSNLVKMGAKDIHFARAQETLASLRIPNEAPDLRIRELEFKFKRTKYPIEKDKKSRCWALLTAVYAELHPQKKIAIRDWHPGLQQELVDVYFRLKELDFSVAQWRMVMWSLRRQTEVIRRRSEADLLGGKNAAKTLRRFSLPNEHSEQKGGTDPHPDWTADAIKQIENQTYKFYNYEALKDLEKETFARNLGVILHETEFSGEWLSGYGSDSIKPSGPANLIRRHVLKGPAISSKEQWYERRFPLDSQKYPDRKVKLTFRGPVVRDIEGEAGNNTVRVAVLGSPLLTEVDSGDKSMIDGKQYKSLASEEMTWGG